MAKVRTTTARYVRTAGISQEYGSIEVGAEELIELSEEEDAAQVRLEHWKALRKEAYDFIAETVEAIKKKPTPGSRRAYPLPTPTREVATTAGRGQGTPVQSSFDDRAPLPETAQVWVEPKYDNEGDRIRKTGFGGNDGFKVAEINEAWQMIYDVGLSAIKPDHTRQANEDRQHVRNWLKMSPLDPGFGREQAEFVVKRYKAWRDQGMTTKEAMAEVGYEYIGHFFRGEQIELEGSPAEGADDGGSGGGDSEAPGDEDGTGPDDPGTPENASESERGADAGDGDEGAGEGDEAPQAPGDSDLP